MVSSSRPEIALAVSIVDAYPEKQDSALVQEDDALIVASHLDYIISEWFSRMNEKQYLPGKCSFRVCLSLTGVIVMATLVHETSCRIRIDFKNSYVMSCSSF